jgi:dTDP-4-dehydrorhamnose reductase
VLRLLPRAGYVVRTAWLYGAHGPNFIAAMIRLERERPTVDVVDNQRGQPTWTVDVARKIVALARSQAPAGVYHATSSGEATWFEVAREVFRLLGADPARVRPTSACTKVRPAPRPGYSVLGHEAWAAIGIEPIGDWLLALRRAFPALAAASYPGPDRPPGGAARVRPA